ncbi:SpoIIE family protein phosphatase [Streptomyces sp. NPDC005181]|uniref:SpoIIE family protein phosphatase n=1 Tax=Streptomyces sp. NPDC005181 TaxID=3156869 RepID=UPI0033B22D7C
MIRSIVGNSKESPAGSLSPHREFVSRTTLPADDCAASAARTFVRAALGEWTDPAIPASPKITDRLVDDAMLLVSELVTNAVVHAGTTVEVVCRLEAGHASPASPCFDVNGPLNADGPVDVVIEVADRHPSRTVLGRKDARRAWYGRGLQLVRARAESWGVTYRRTQKTVWFRLETTAEEPETVGSPLDEAPDSEPSTAESLATDSLHTRRDDTAEWVDRGGPSFLAEASELLAGQLDEDMVAALAGQLLVPRLADWCGVWLSTENGGLRLSRVWHADERCIDALRRVLEKDPPPARLATTGIPWPWPESANTGGSAIAFPLVTGGRCHGVLLLGRAGLLQMTDAVVRLAEDLVRRVAQAVVTARQYTEQTTISRALQRRQLPASLADIPGVDTAIVYEPRGHGQTVGGDFYDLFPMAGRRWGFLLGDVCGHDPEAMSVTGLARHLVRLLAREGHGVESVLTKLNCAMAEESAEAAALGGEQARPQFLSLLYGELEPDPVTGGAHCKIASAGHPLPLRLSADGSVAPMTDPQMLLGIDDHAKFHSNTFDLAPSETLLCVTDGVTERRSGNRQLDDDDGLSELLRGCVGLGATAVAERVRQAVHAFDTGPVEDDLAVLVIGALPVHVARAEQVRDEA